MDTQQQASFEAQSQQLRADLKTWETLWAKSHDGKKPGRDDIKRNEDIGMHSRVKASQRGREPRLI